MQNLVHTVPSSLEKLKWRRTVSENIMEIAENTVVAHDSDYQSIKAGNINQNSLENVSN